LIDVFSLFFDFIETLGKRKLQKVYTHLQSCIC